MLPMLIQVFNGFLWLCGLVLCLKFSFVPCQLSILYNLFVHLSLKQYISISLSVYIKTKHFFFLMWKLHPIMFTMQHFWTLPGLALWLSGEEEPGKLKTLIAFLVCDKKKDNCLSQRPVKNIKVCKRDGIIKTFSPTLFSLIPCFWFSLLVISVSLTFYFHAFSLPFFK